MFFYEGMILIMRNHIKKIIIIFFIIIFLELTVFNFKSYRVLYSKNSRTFEGEEIVKIETEENMSIYNIYNVGQEIKTIHIELNNEENVVYEISCNDETMADISALPSKVYISNFENSKYISVYLSRKN